MLFTKPASTNACSKPVNANTYVEVSKMLVQCDSKGHAFHALHVPPLPCMYLATRRLPYLHILHRLP